MVLADALDGMSRAQVAHQAGDGPLDAAGLGHPVQRRRGPQASMIEPRAAARVGSTRASRRR